MTSPKSKEQVVPEGKTPLSDFPADILNVAAQAVDEMPQRAPFKADVLEAIARAILAERERDKWQDIATAPKDGTPILAYNAIVGVYNTAYQSHEPNESDRFPCGFSGYLGNWFCYPTHWMPLPTPPKGGGE